MDTRAPDVAGLRLHVLRADQRVLGRPAGYRAGRAAGATAIDAPVAAFIANLQFITGTAAFIPALGLLIAGVAVPSFFMRFGPRPFVIFAWVVAAISLISVFAMLTPALDFTLPIGRFGGLIAILVFSVVLPKQRSPRQR